MGIMSADTERITGQIGRMSREQVKKAIQQYQGKFKMDFTEQYLDSLPLDRLQHILLAAELRQCRH